MRRTIVAAAATVLAASGLVVAQQSDAAPARPAGVSLVRTYETAQGVKITWADPHSAYKHLAFRYQRGATAPAIGKGTWVPQGHDAASATLRKLTPGAQYSVSIWTYSGSHYSPRATTTFRAPRAGNDTGLLRGVVKDSSGRPLRGVAFTATDLTTQYTGRSGTSGAYSIRLPAGVWYLTVDPAKATGGSTDRTGYYSSEFTARMNTARTLTQNLTLHTAGAITGRIVDAAGKPLRNVAVFERVLDPVLPFTSGTSEAPTAGSGTAVTAADGTYRLRGALGYSSQLCVRSGIAPTGAGGVTPRCVKRAIAVAPGATRSAGDTVATSHPTGGLRVTVTAGGHRVDRALVSVFGDGELNSDVQLDRIANSAGTSELHGLVTGRYVVCVDQTRRTTRVAAVPGYQEVCRHVTVTAGGTAASTIAMPLGSAISGTVVGPQGPLANVRVLVGTRDVLSDEDLSGSVRTDSAGRYRVTGLPGNVSFTACTLPSPPMAGAPTGVRSSCYRDRSTALLTAGTTRILDITAPAGAAIKGTVRTAGGKPVRQVVAVGAALKYRGRDESSDANGRYAIGGLPAARYDVCAEAYYPAGTYAEVCSKATATTGRTATRDLRLPKAGTVRAHAIDSSGHALSGVDAVLLKACTSDEDDNIYVGGCAPIDAFNATRTVEAVASANTLANGSVDLQGVKPGRYALCFLGFRAASATSVLPASGVHDVCTKGFDVTVTDAHVTTVARTLTAGAGVSGRVTDTAGKGIANVRVYVSRAAFIADNGGDENYGFVDPPDAVTDKSGNYTMRSATPGGQTVCFDASHAGTTKSGYKNQCIGGKPGRDDDGTPVTLKTGANPGVDQVLQTGPPQVSDPVAATSAAHRATVASAPSLADALARIRAAVLATGHRSAYRTYRA